MNLKSKSPCDCGATDWVFQRTRFSDGILTHECDRCTNMGNFPPVEVEPQRIKEERKEYAKSVLQPYRGGELSQEYVQTYGTKGLQGVTKEQVKKAKPVWKDVLPSGWEKSK